MNGQTTPRIKRIICRLTPDEYAKLERKWKLSTCHKLSDYIRRILFDKPIVTTFRNRSFDDLMTEMIKLRNELNNIGNNFNQAVKRLHTLDNLSEFRSWLILYETEKKLLFDRIDEIKNHIQKLGEKWLQ